MLVSDEDVFLRRAFALAARAKRKGNHPFGALLVIDHAVVLIAENTVVSNGSATCHAEMNLAAMACRTLSLDERGRAVLYTSTEPCAMCSGAIYWAGIRKVVFGCSAATLGSFAGRALAIGCREIFSRGVETTTVIGPCLEKEAAELHRGFWA